MPKIKVLKIKKGKAPIVKPEKVDKYYQRIFTKIRREWSFHSPIKKECALLARKQLGPSHYKWECRNCTNLFAWSEIAFDHISPIGNTIPRTIEEFLICAEKLNCPLSNLQVLCKKCHVLKTNLDEQNEIRPILEKECQEFLKNKGYFLITPKLSFKDMRRLHIIISKFNSIKDDKKLNTWHRKLLEFIKIHG